LDKFGQLRRFRILHIPAHIRRFHNLHIQAHIRHRHIPARIPHSPAHLQLVRLQFRPVQPLLLHPPELLAKNLPAAAQRHHLQSRSRCLQTSHSHTG
jgi:hypothetical protein